MAEDINTARLAAFFEGAPDAIVVVNAAGQIVRANDHVEEVFGYDPAALEGEPVERLVPEAAREDHPAQREAYMADPTTRPMGASLDLHAQHKDGSTFPVDISLSPIKTDDRVEVIAAVRDITDREALRRKYRTVLETAPDAMVIADAETGEILEVNQRATELVGRPEDSLIGEHHSVLHPTADEQRYRDLFEQHATDRTGTVARFADEDELFVETASGKQIPVEINAQATAISGRNVVIGVFRDISNRQAYEHQLHRQIERLEKLAEVLSHDLRNPLNVAEMRTDLTQRTGELDHLERVETAHDRMEQLIDDALTLIQEGHEVESVEPVELQRVATECWEHVRTPDASMELDPEGIIYTDTRRIRNLFENLFRNAVEHGGDGITVRVGVAPNGFFVADDGPGIPESERKKALQPGWSTDESGTGLGLNIVSEIAGAHDWEIAVTESERGGARFDFTGVRTIVYDDSFCSEQ